MALGSIHLLGGLITLAHAGVSPDTNQEGGITFATRCVASFGEWLDVEVGENWTRFLSRGSVMKIGFGPAEEVVCRVQVFFQIPKGTCWRAVESGLETINRLEIQKRPRSTF